MQSHHDTQIRLLRPDSSDGQVVVRPIYPDQSAGEDGAMVEMEEWNGRVQAIVTKINRNTKAESAALRSHIDTLLGAAAASGGGPAPNGPSLHWSGEQDSYK